MDEVTLVHRLLRQEPGAKVMIDVGAHRGSSLLRFAKEGWRVHAFEPDPANRRRLLERVAELENVSVDPRAVAARIERGLPFFASEVSSGISGLSAFHDSHRQVCTVDSTTLADYCAERGVDAVDFLKIDTEGMDLRVLEGVPWDALTPAIILCEFEDAKTIPLGYGFRDLGDFLVERGYAVWVSEWHPVIRYGNPHDWRRLVRYPCDLAEPSAWGNFLAFQREPDRETAEGILERAVRVDGRARSSGIRRMVSRARNGRAVRGVTGLAEALSAVAKERWRSLGPAVGKSWKIRQVPAALQSRAVWLGLLGSMGLTLYGLSGYPGAALAKAWSLLPLVVGIYLRHRGALRYGAFERRRFHGTLVTVRRRLEASEAELSRVEAWEERLAALERGTVSRLRELEASVNAAMADAAEKAAALEGVVRAIEAGLGQVSERSTAIGSELEGLQLEVRGLRSDQQEDRVRMRDSESLREARVSQILTSLEQVKEDLGRLWTVREEDREEWSLDLEKKIATERELRSRELASAVAALNGSLLEFDRAWREVLGERLEESGRLLLDRFESAEHELVGQMAKLGARMGDLEREQERDSTPLLERLEDLERRVEVEDRRERAERILAFAKRDSSGSLPERCLLMVAVPRSGSTWLFDALRCHPWIRVEPTAIVFRALGLRGGRYPRDLADRSDGSMDFEIREGFGARIPQFEPPETEELHGVDWLPDVPYSVEKIHPEFFGFDPVRFRSAVLEVVGGGSTEFELLYLVRSPEAVARSILSYKARDATWYRHVHADRLGTYLERSFRSILELVTELPGRVCDYGELSKDFEGTLERLHADLCPEADPGVLRMLAAQAYELTSLERRVALRSSSFIGAGKNESKEDLLSLEGLELEESRELYANILRLRDA